MLRALLFLLFFIPWTLVCALSAIIFTLFDASGRSYHAHARLWSWLALKVGGTRLKVTGTEQIPCGQPVIFMGNHQGNFDVLALFHAIPRRFTWMAKEGLFKVPVVGYSMRRAGYISLDRGNSSAAIKSMENAAAAIRGGSSVIVFPEGTRTHDGSLLPFKKGGFHLAINAGVPIIPFTINGSRRINPRNRMELHPGELSIHFGAPILTTGTSAEQPAELMGLMEQVRLAIASHLKV
jgi:1-acyl-sn-glycerol-3-phosphate acyltransferase